MARRLPTDEWKREIERVENLLRTEYIGNPRRLIADSNLESADAGGYRGREILELLQNADDAGVDRQGGGTEHVRVKMILSRSSLTVANSGQTMLPDDLDAIAIAATSNKKSRYSRFIGNKGRGIRSLLNWTDSPTILSGALHVGFSRSHARDCVTRLAAEEPGIKKQINRELARGNELPAPVFAFPFCVDTGSASGPPKGRLKRETLAQALHLQAAGFTSVVVLPFPSVRHFKAATDALQAFDPTLLLFVNNIDELEILSTAVNKFWKVGRPLSPQSTSEIRISGREGSDSTVWELHLEQGTFPASSRERDVPSDASWEVRVAIPRLGEASGRLFSFLPTGVTFPFPLLAHGTFELSENREDLKPNSKPNAFVARKLAHLMVHVAEGAFSREDPWYSVNLVFPHEGNDKPRDIGESLVRSSFKDELFSRARNAKILPRFDGAPGAPNSTPRLSRGAYDFEYSFTDWLPREEFADIIISPSSWYLQRFLVNDLEVGTLEATTLKSRLERVSPHLTVAERGRLIRGLIRSSLMPTPPPSLLIDESGLPIPSDAQIFLAPPSEKESVSPPSWLEVKFVSKELTEALVREFSASDRQSLQDQLSASWPSIHEFSPAGLVNATVLQAKSVLTADSSRSEAIWDEATRFAFLVFSQFGTGRSLGPNLNLELRNVDGGRTPSDRLYLSKDYASGEIVDALLRLVSPAQLVASPDELCLKGSSEKVERFLEWLGIAKFPRTTDEAITDSAYIDFVEARLPSLLKARDGRRIIRERGESLRETLVKGSNLEHLSEILSNAAPEAILAWIALDERFQKWAETGDSSLRIFAKGPRMRGVEAVARPSKLDPYPLWMLRNTPWLPADDARSRLPKECIQQGSFPASLHVVFPVVKTESNPSDFQRVKLDKRRRRSALDRLGVAQSIQDLKWDRFYKVLTDLPTLDPGGAIAPVVYTILLGHPASPEHLRSNERAQFTSMGSLFGKHGGQVGYFPVGDLFYNDSARLPRAIAEHVPLLSLDKKTAASHVEALFGVRPLSSYLKISLVERPPDCSEGRADAAVADLKGPIYALVVDQDQSGEVREKVRTLSAKVVTSVRVALETKAGPITLSINEGPSLLLLDNEALFIMSDAPAGDLLSEPGIKGMFVELFRRIIGTDDGEAVADLVASPAGSRSLVLEQFLGATSSELLQRAIDSLGPLRPSASDASPEGDAMARDQQESLKSTGIGEASSSGAPSPTREESPSPPQPTVSAGPAGSPPSPSSPDPTGTPSLGKPSAPLDTGLPPSSLPPRSSDERAELEPAAPVREPSGTVSIPEGVTDTTPVADQGTGEQESTAGASEQDRRDRWAQRRSFRRSPRQHPSVPVSPSKSARKYGSGGESPEHLALKNYVAMNPAILAPVAEGLELEGTEFRFESGDEADILFADSENVPVAVEIEPRSGDLNLGAWQAAKYRHLAAQHAGLSCDVAKGVLVAPSIPQKIRMKCRELGVSWVEVPLPRRT